MSPVYDILSLPYWGYVLFAAFVMTLLARRIERDLAFFLLNVCFLSALLQEEAVYLYGGILLIWILARLDLARRTHGIGALFIFAGALFLFLVNKQIFFAEATPERTVVILLRGVGYSYVFLRLLDFLAFLAVEKQLRSNPFQLLNYLVPFHMLLAGPIQSYAEYVETDDSADGVGDADHRSAINRIVNGLFKTVVLGRLLKDIASSGWASEGLYWWLEVQLNYIWVFLDFSGYTDIAVGIGALMGVKTPENFNKPLSASNLTIFWERWHMSLSLWIRRNLFVPVQLFIMRSARAPSAVTAAAASVFASFVLCGLWHAISLRFFLWGVGHGAGLMICILYRHFMKKLLGGKRLKRLQANRAYVALCWFITFQFVALSFWCVTDVWESGFIE